MRLREILAATAADNGLAVAIMLNPGMRRHAPARQEFMWRARQVYRDDGLVRYSYPQIGRFLDQIRAGFGWKSKTDHTTIIHGVRAHALRCGLEVIFRPQIVNIRKTHCVRGHEFTPDNLYEYKLAHNRRGCRICGRMTALAYRERQRALRCEELAA